MSDYETILAIQWLETLLKAFLEVNPIAGLTNQEFGFSLNIRGKKDIRRPDLGIVALNENPVRIAKRDRSYKGTFDLCVEAMSVFWSCNKWNRL